MDALSNFGSSVSRTGPALASLPPSPSSCPRQRRVRPPLPGQGSIVGYPLEGLLSVSPPDRREHEFEFDHVFPPESTQVREGMGKGTRERRGGGGGGGREGGEGGSSC